MSFTEDELRKLLEDVYSQGYTDAISTNPTVIPYRDTQTVPDKYFPQDWSGAPIVTCGQFNESHSEPNPNIRVTNATSFFQSVPGSEGAL